MKQIAKTLIAIVVFSTLLSAQKIDRNSVENYEFFLKNLKQSLMSESPGIQQSAINLAGKHKVEEAVPTLEKLLSKTSDEKMKVLIAQSLFEIGTESSMEILNELAENEKSKYLKEIYRNLCELYSKKAKSL